MRPSSAAEGIGQQGAHGRAAEVAGCITDIDIHLCPKFDHHLATEAAGRAAVHGNNGDRTEFPFPLGDCGRERDPFGADRSSVGGVFDVTSRDDFAVLCQHGGADGPIIAGMIFDAQGSYDWAFVGCIGLFIVGAGAALTAPELRADRPAFVPGLGSEP